MENSLGTCKDNKARANGHPKGKPPESPPPSIWGYKEDLHAVGNHWCDGKLKEENAKKKVYVSFWITHK